MIHYSSFFFWYLLKVHLKIIYLKFNIIQNILLKFLTKIMGGF